MMRSGIKLLQRCGARAAASRALSTAAGGEQRLMYPIISKEDFGAFKEYSVIHTDRSLNLMSDPFQRVMRDLNNLLKVTYNCDKVAIIPGEWWRHECASEAGYASDRVYLMIYPFPYNRIWYLWHGSCRSSVCHERTCHGAA